MQKNLFSIRSVLSVVLLFLTFSIHANAQALNSETTSNSNAFNPPAINFNPLSTGGFYSNFEPDESQSLLYDNGSVFNIVGSPMLSILQDTSLNMSTYGFGAQVSANNRMADDFILESDVTLSTIDFYVYQTGASTETINAVHVRIFDGEPGSGGSVIWGNLTTNVLLNVELLNGYRQLESLPGDTSRRIQKVTANLDNVLLEAGSYWVEFTFGGTLTSGPWVPPITITGVTTTGNAKQYTGDSGTYSPILDGGTSTPQGLPFQIYGEEANIEDCSGIPNAGTISGVDTICPNNAFTLTAEGITVGVNGLSRKWQSSPTGENNWVDINNAIYSVYNVSEGINAATDYRFVLTCTVSGETAYSSVHTVDLKPSEECYCIPQGTNSARYINDFSTTGAIQNISNMNTGFSTGGYGDFYDTHTIEQVAGESIQFNVDIKGGTAGFRIWVDWNQDGTFDTTEEVAWNSNSYEDSHSGSFIVPTAALEGETRMRIVSHWLSTTGNISPCATGFTYGEFEDYKFIVVEGDAGTDPDPEDCQAANVPYIMDFETAVTPDIPECTSIENVGSGNNWNTFTGSSYGFTGTFLRYAWHGTNPANAWFYTQGINLEAGETYKISYDYGGTGTYFDEKLKVAYGTAAENTAMTTILADHPNVINDLPLTNEVTFTPDTSGVYYFGFNAYSNANKFYLHVDNIEIIVYDETTDPDPEPEDCEAANVPYIMDFETAVTPDIPECTSIENVGSGNNWNTFTGSSYGFTGTFLRYAWHGTNPANAWFYTQGINLEAGETYKISYDYGGTGTYFDEKLKVAYGTAAENTAMTTILADHPNVINDLPLTNEVTFTPDTSGVYYFGFNAYSNANKFYLHVDNIEIVVYDETTDPDPEPTEYCEPELDCTDGDVITNVTFQEINNNTACSPNGYGDYTSMEANVAAGGTYPISVTVGNGWPFESVSVWIDFDNSGTFDQDEFFFIGTGSNETLTGDITIPANLADGSYRMRVRVVADGEFASTYDMACDETQVYGETEDYTVQVGELGVSDLSSFDFAYYPNPVRDVLNITSQKTVQSVEVYNLTGQKVMAENKVNQDQIDVSKLAAGTYVFRVTLDNGQVETFKIIKK